MLSIDSTYLNDIDKQPEAHNIGTKINVKNFFRLVPSSVDDMICMQGLWFALRNFYERFSSMTDTTPN